MSKRPQSTPPPGRPGKAVPARRGGPTQYKRPVQSPDAETVMLAQFTAEPEAEPRSGPQSPGPGHPEAHGAAGAPSANGRSSIARLVSDHSGVMTRILVMPRGKRGGPASFSEPSARRTWVSRATLAAILCVQAVLSLRLRNTAFGDEGLYLYAGHMEIGHLLHGAALQGTYASYFPGVPVLYPVLGAAASAIGGLAAARAISLLAMLVTTGLLYSLTRQLFNERVGLCAAVLFSVTEGTILAGSLATNDAVSLCLLAVASWLVVRTASWHWRAYMLAMPVACLAAATDYWALLYLPTLALLAALAAHPHLGRPALVRAPVMGAIMVEVVAAGVLVAGRDYVTAAVATTASRSAGGGAALTILAEAGKWGGLIAALAVLGVVAYSIRARNEPNENIALPGNRRRRIALGVALSGTALLTVADQLYLNTDLTLDTHLAFGLFFAAPMAGVGLARLVGDHFRRAQIGVVAWAVALILGLAQSSQVYGSWPNSSALVGELTRLLGPKDRYLVENDNVPIYYLTGRPDAQPDQFTSTYFMSYRTPDGLLTGTPAYLAALRAGYFNVVIYDSSVTPALDRSLSSALESDPRYRLAGTVPEDAPDFHTTCYIWVRT
ncbi:MAG TPA: glycosyltransferase family 39 protein [Streptosporangiaceae bacterium]|nr:glycosyltransferase family 39 protein [Streptosporangiaceae bacterium]